MKTLHSGKPTYEEAPEVEVEVEAETKGNAEATTRDSVEVGEGSVETRVPHNSHQASDSPINDFQSFNQEGRIKH